MSGIIKSGNLADLSVVRPVAVPAAISAASIRQEEERERSHKRIAALEEDLHKRDASITALRADVERAFEEGKTQGHAAGLAEAQDRQAERLSLLDNAVRQALEKMSTDLSSLERLAAVLARECLDKILGSPDDHAELLGQIISKQIAKIDKVMLLGIEVSQQDFPDDEALAALGKRIGLSAVALTARDDMASGGCVMQLRLGRMNIGIDRQWGALREVLDEMALPEGAA